MLWLYVCYCVCGLALSAKVCENNKQLFRKEGMLGDYVHKLGTVFANCFRGLWLTQGIVGFPAGLLCRASMQKESGINEKYNSETLLYSNLIINVLYLIWLQRVALQNKFSMYVTETNLYLL